MTSKRFIFGGTEYLNPVCSIVIPTYRREQILCDTLRALLAMDLSGCEIIVVDQTPDHEPATREYLASIRDRITYLTMDTPSASGARNVGWRVARGETILFLDDDVLPHPGLIEAHLRAYNEPTVGCVAGRVITAGVPLPDTPNPKSRWPGVGWLFFNFAQTVPCEVAAARGCNMSFRRRVLEELGGFDEQYDLSPCEREDSDLCFRARRRGYRLVFEPGATVDHLMHPSGGTRVAEKDPALSPAHHVNNFYFFWKNIPWRHRPLTFLVFLAQELRPRRAGFSQRNWRATLTTLRLFLRGMWAGWRLAQPSPRRESLSRV